MRMLYMPVPMTLADLDSWVKPEAKRFVQMTVLRKGVNWFANGPLFENLGKRTKSSRRYERYTLSKYPHPRRKSRKKSS